MLRVASAACSVTLLLLPQRHWVAAPCARTLKLRHNELQQGDLQCMRAYQHAFKMLMQLSALHATWPAQVQTP